MGGSKGKSETKTDQMSWAEYVPPEVRDTFRNILPKLESKYDVGLTPMEKAYYEGTATTGINKQYAGSQKSLSEALARTGGSANSGAATEAYSDLARGRIGSMADAFSQITGMDIARKDTNTNRLLSMLMSNYQPIQTGSTTTTTQPSNWGGPVGSALGIVAGGK